MKRILFLLVLLFTMTLCACEAPPSQTQPPEGDVTEEKVTYTITFDLGTKKETQTVAEGEMPVPPTVPDADFGTVLRRLTGWDKEISPAMENTTYTAIYETVQKTYKATFVMAEETVTLEFAAGTAPIAPDVPDYNCASFALWDKALDITNEDVSFTALYTKVVGKSAMKIAWAESNWQYQNHGFRDMQAGTSILSLAIEEHENPMGTLVRDRLIAHLTSYVASDGAPAFTASCLWDYGITTAIIAVVRDTPTVWDNIPVDIKLRIETLMQAFIYLESFATSDENDYRTGPALGGNYRKSWNPNYRLANVPVMVYATYYFGAGDIEKGAARVNELLRGFNEEVYNEMINLFIRYGWRRASNCWRTEGPVITDSFGTSTQAPGAKELLISGGVAYGKDTYDPSKITYCGEGKGVTNGGKDYFYNKNPLTAPERILEDLLYFNYSGGEVQNGHWWDVDGDGKKELVAWILDDTESPYFGMQGMMLEFASGNRSSTAYCDHDFTIVVALLGASVILPRYTEVGGEREVMKDENGNTVVLYDPTENPDLWQLIQVGNEDFIYKFIHGYQCYSTGSYGTAQDRHSESGASRGYWSMKSLWRTYFLPKGNIAPAK